MPFGFDWMGREYAVDTINHGILLMFDPSKGEVFKLPQTFHTVELVDERENILSESSFDDLKKVLNIESNNYKSCLGYKVPLFLGGRDGLGNDELVDMDVYWSLQG